MFSLPGNITLYLEVQSNLCRSIILPTGFSIPFTFLGYCLVTFLFRTSVNYSYKQANMVLNTLTCTVGDNATNQITNNVPLIIYRSSSPLYVKIIMRVNKL